jgi:uncharacterized protein (TIGR02594 family)
MRDYLELAFSQYGIVEIVGAEDNNEIVKYFDSLGFDGSKLKDETAWCAAFANWVLKESCYDYTGKLNARSFLKLGEEIEKPEIGDIVIFWRVSKNDWRGHVGFYINEDEDWVYCLGGNQGNSVNIKPYAKRRVLGYRKINKLEF